MRVFQLPTHSHIYCLGHRHDLFYIDNKDRQLHRLDLATLDKTRIGAWTEKIIQILVFTDCLLLIIEGSGFGTDHVVMIDLFGTILWRNKKVRLWWTRSSLFCLDANDRLVQLDLKTGLERRRYKEGYWPSHWGLEVGLVLRNIHGDYDWLDEEGNPQPMPFDDPNILGEDSSILSDGSMVCTTIYDIVQSRGDDVVKTWPWNGDRRLGDTPVLGFTAMANGDIMVRHGKDDLRDPHLAGLHFRYYGSTRGCYTVEKVFWQGPRVYDHRVYRPGWLVVGLHRLLPMDLMGLVVEYAG